MITLRYTDKIKFWIIVGITLSCINLWSFQLLSEGFYKSLEAVCTLLLVLTVLFNTSVLTDKRFKFRKITLLFVLLPFLSMIGSNVFHDQSLSFSFLTVRYSFFWLLYFVLHIYNVPSEKIIKLLIIIGCVWAFLTIIQQFTYPHYYFYTRADGDRKSIYRAGVYRYMVTGVQYGVFVLLYGFYIYLTKKQAINLLFVLFMLVGLYFFGTRQNLVAAGGCMLICVLYLQGLARWKYLLLFAVGFAILILFSSLLFGELMEMTSRQLDDEDYIRFMSADFFLYDYWPHWSAKFIGNGRSHAMSDYGVEMEMVKEMGYYRSDIGIIGTYNEYGIFYVFNIIVLFFTGVFFKMKSRKFLYLKLYFFYFALLLMLSIEFTYASSIPFYCFLFYLLDKTCLEEDSIETTSTENSRNVRNTQSLRPRQFV